MAADSQRNPRVQVDPGDERYYHEAYLKLAPEKVAAARKALVNPTERDIVKFWEIKGPQVS